MSNGFRVFLLILLVFASIWLYRLREPFLERFVMPYQTFARDVEPGQSVDSAVGVFTERPPATELLPSVDLEALVSSGWDSSGKWSGAEPPQAPADVPPSEWRDVFPELDVAGDPALAQPQPEIVQEPAQPVPPTTIAGSEVAGSGRAPAAFDEDLVPGADNEENPSASTGGATTESPAPSQDRTQDDAFEEIVYTVEDGDMLWKIADKLLGDPKKYGEIQAMNQDVLPDIHHLRVGMKLKVRVPRTKKIERSQKSLKIEAAESDSTVKPGSAREREPALKRTHRVAADETLSRIAGKYFPGDSGAVTAIYEANQDQLSSPHDIRQGQLLVIPPR